MRWLTFCVFFVPATLFSLDRSPSILRVCYDNNTSMATVYWQKVSDTCNSFKKYLVYSSENNGPWKLEKKILSPAVLSSQVYISDINSFWKFRITAYTGCNGTDSFYSNEQLIDQTKPPLIELDSVSFELSTQKLIAGWQKNPAPDTKGYRLYEYSNSVNNFITDTSGTFWLSGGYGVSNPVTLTMATFDSCDLFSPISQGQKASYLNGTIDTCRAMVNLGWSLYTGWINTRQHLYLNLNNTGFVPVKTFLTGETSYQISGIKLGDNLCYFIQTEETSLKKTSSSNVICFATRKLKSPVFNYLNTVSVENDSYLRIDFSIDKNADIDSVLVEKSLTGPGGFFRYTKFKFNPLQSSYSIKDLNTLIFLQSYSYRIKTYDKCLFTNSVSNTGNSILLNKPDYMNSTYSFRWNPYVAWENGVKNQVIEISTNRSTWNTYQTVTSSVASVSYPKDLLDSDSACFRVRAIESVNSFGLFSESISNVRCVYPVTEFYFPETINPFSQNNTFKIYGTGWDPTRARMEIYNRWGERVFETTDIGAGWNGTLNGIEAEMGNYIYKVSFYDRMNKFYLRKGSILVIK